MRQFRPKSDIPITYPTRHKAETTKSRTDTKGTLTTELDSDEPERLVTRGDQSEVSPTEQVWRQSGELRLGEDAIRVHFHQPCQLFGSKTSIEIDNGANADQLDGRLLLQSIYGQSAS